MLRLRSSRRFFCTSDTQSLKRMIIPKNSEIKPETNKKFLRLYNDPYCHECIRTKLMMINYNVKFQDALVHPDFKPEWFPKVNKATKLLPLLEETEGSLFYNSEVVIEYAVNQSPDYAPDGLDVERFMMKKKIVKIDYDLPSIFYRLKHSKPSKASSSKLILPDDDHSRARRDLDKKLNEIENIFKNSKPENKFILNSPIFTLADARISPFLVRLYLGVKKDHKSLSGISLDKYPLTSSYIERLINDEKLSQAFCLDEPVIPESSVKVDMVDPKTQGLDTIYILDGNSSKPSTNKNYYRIYGHELCPDVESAMLAFSAKNMKYQFCGMDLKTKSDWHLKINGGSIPLLETPDGVILHESGYICELVQEINKNTALTLLSENIVERIQEKLLVDKTTKIAFSLFNTGSEMDPQKRVKILQELNEFFPKTEPSSPFLCQGDNESMADLMLLPIIHRALLISASPIGEEFFENLDFSNYPCLVRWYQTLRKKYSHILVPYEPYANHFQRRWREKLPLFLNIK